MIKRKICVQYRNVSRMNGKMEMDLPVSLRKRRDFLWDCKAILATGAAPDRFSNLLQQIDASWVISCRRLLILLRSLSSDTRLQQCGISADAAAVNRFVVEVTAPQLIQRCLLNTLIPTFRTHYQRLKKKILIVM